MKLLALIASAVPLVLMFNGCEQTTPPAAPASITTTIEENGEGKPTDDDAPIYRVRYTGRPGQSEDVLRQNALQAAADLTRQQGHTHFAVVEEGAETVVGSGSISRVETTMPIVRSQRRGGRGRRTSASKTIELGRPKAPAFFVRMTPYSGAPPPNAIATYPIIEFQ